jgi:hypothetical protein
MAERNKLVPMSVLQLKSLVVWTGRALCPLNVTKNKAVFVTDHTCVEIFLVRWLS